MTDLDRLRQLAEQATKGPWQRSHFVDGPRFKHVDPGTKERWREEEQLTLRGPGVIGTPECNPVLRFSWVTKEDMTFIAAFNPAVALELLDRIKELQDKVDGLELGCRGFP